MKPEASFDIKANDRTAKAFASVNKKLKQLSVDVLKYTSIAGAAITGLSVVSARNAKEMTAYARAIGVGVEELSAWGYASNTVSVSQEKLNDILKDTSEKIGDAFANKGGEALEILERLNLSTKEMAALSPDQQLLKIAEGLSSVGTQSEKVLILESLASDASLLIPLLENDAEKLKLLTAEAKATGAALSDIDAARIEAANNAWDKTLSILTGVGNKIASQLSPYIVEIADRFGIAATESNGFGEAVERSMKIATVSVAYLGNVIRSLEIGIKVIEVGFVGFGELVIDTIFTIVDGWRQLANLIPGLDIGPMETLEAITREAGDQTARFANELNELVSKPMPSTAIEEFFNSVDERATQSAEKIAAVTSGGGSIGGEASTIAFNEEAAAKLEALNDSLLAEDERLILAHENRQIIAETAFQNGLINDARRNEILQNLELKHQAALGNIEAKGMIAREKFRKKSSLAKNKQVFGEIASLTAGVAQSNKTLFNINKVAGIANAGIAAYEGISLTLSKYPYPLNIGLAALHGAAAFAQIKAIKSTTFGAGGGAPSIAGGGGGGSSTVNTIPFAGSTQNQQQETQQTSGGTTTINLVGQDKTFTSEQVEGMFDHISEAIERGDKVLFSSNSRQALELTA